MNQNLFYVSFSFSLKFSFLSIKTSLSIIPPIGSSFDSMYKNKHFFMSPCIFLVNIELLLLLHDLFSYPTNNSKLNSTLHPKVDWNQSRMQRCLNTIFISTYTLITVLLLTPSVFSSIITQLDNLLRILLINLESFINWSFLFYILFYDILNEMEIILSIRSLTNNNYYIQAILQWD